MKKLTYLLLALSTINLAACSSNNVAPIVGLVGDSDNMQSAGLSKYSVSQALWVGDQSNDDSIQYDGKDLPRQSVYVTSGARNRLVDHYFGNDRPNNLPLTSWKNDYIAGELALAAMDLTEAKRMFELAAQQATKEKAPDEKTQEALCKIRLGYIARREGDLVRAALLYKAALPVLQRDEKENERAIDLTLYEMALVASKSKDFSAEEKALRDRLELRVRRHGAMGITIAAAMNDLANSLFYQRKFADADKLYLQTAVMAERFKQDTNYSLFAYFNLANCRYEQKRYADALALHQKMSEYGRTDKRTDELKVLVASLPTDQQQAHDLPPPLGSEPVWTQLIAAGKDDLANDRLFDAKQVFAVALKEAQSIGSQNKRVAETAMYQGDCACEQGDYRRAMEYYNQALTGDQRINILPRLMLAQLISQDDAAAKKSFSEFEKVATPTAWAELVAPLAKAFERRSLNHRSTEADELLITICQRCRDAVKNNPSANAVALSNLAHAYQSAQQSENALPLFEQALQAMKIAGREDAMRWRTQTDLAQVYMFASQFSSAEALLKGVLAHAQSQPGKDNRELQAALQRMAALYNNWHRPDQEEFYYKQQIALEVPDSSPTNRVRTELNHLSNFARISLAKGDYDQAAQFMEQTIALQEKQPDTRPGDTSSTRRELVRAYEALGRWDKLEETYLQAAQPLGSGQQWRQETFAAANAALRQGKYDPAQKLLESIVADFESTKDTPNRMSGCVSIEPTLSGALLTLANCIVDGHANYDKAISLYDRAMNSIPNLRGPGCGIQDGTTVAPSAVPLSAEQLVDFVICCDGIGNKKRAEGYRTQLKQFSDRGMQSVSSPESARHSEHNAVITLLENTKRTPEQNIKLMESVSRVLHPSGSYSQPDNANLLIRAIAWRNAHGGKTSTETAADLKELISQYLDGHRPDQAEPWSRQLIALLKQTHAQPIDIAKADIDFASVLQGRGFFDPARKKFSEALPILQSAHSNDVSQVLQKLADCEQMLDEYDSAIAHLKQALIAAPDAKQRRTVQVRLAALYDVEGKKQEAISLYQAAAENVQPADRYAVYEPLRGIADWASSRKLYSIADSLYRRQVELLSADSPIGAANAWMQLGRMYRWAKRYSESQKAYEQAIAVYRTHPGDTFMTSQIQSAEQEMNQMLSSR